MFVIFFQFFLNQEILWFSLCRIYSLDRSQTQVLSLILLCAQITEMQYHAWPDTSLHCDYKGDLCIAETIQMCKILKWFMTLDGLSGFVLSEINMYM